MHTLICGSIAYDTIMVFPGRFKRAHPRREAAHPQRRVPGAGNAPRVRRLRGQHRVQPEPAGRRAAKSWPPSATTRSRMPIGSTSLSCRSSTCARSTGTFTAQAFITTDLDDNQITAFHPGAMNHSHQNHVGDAAGVTLGIVAPDGRDGMLQHAREFHAAGIPFIFDPGQGLPMFSGEELFEFVRQADYVDGQRLRGAGAAGTNRPDAGHNRAEPEGADRHARRAGLADLRERPSNSKSRARGRQPSSTRRAAAMLIAPGFCMASPTDSIGN